MNNLSKIIPLLTIASLAFMSCQKESSNESDATTKESTEKSISVVVSSLQASRFEDWVAYPAELRGVQDVVLGAGGGGRVLWVAEAGTRVAKGQPLCDIESERYAALLAQAQAALNLMQGEYDRTEANVQAGSVGKAALDKAKLDLEGAKVGLFQAKRAYEDSRCEAPFHGVVVSRSMDRFQNVGPGAPTVRVARVDRFEALVSLSESDLPTYAKGSPVRFSVPSIAERDFDGKLKALDQVVDSKTRTATARLEVQNKDGLLLPGMAGRALLLRKIYENTIVVPATALLRSENQVYAVVADNGMARQRTLVLGPAHGDSVVVLSGLQAGDQLVVEGAFKATEGSRLTVISNDTVEAK